jgi:hypothetical protein
MSAKENVKLMPIEGSLSKVASGIVGWAANELLEAEKAGIITGIGLSFIYQDGDVSSNYTAANLGSLIGAVEVLKHTIVEDILYSNQEE